MSKLKKLKRNRPLLQCQICGYTWFSDRDPRWCARCKSARWRDATIPRYPGRPKKPVLNKEELERLRG